MFDDILGKKSIDKIKPKTSIKPLSKYHEFFRIMDDLIALNKKNRTVDVKNIGRYNYLKEYCTIIFDMGRQTGKTEYIIRNAKKDDLVIVYNDNWVDIIKDDVPCKVINIGDIISGYSCGGIETLWVNDFRIITNKYNNSKIMDDICLKFLDSRVEQTFIGLG